MTYSTGTGKNQEHYDRLWNALVPDSGKCEYLEGELLRAVGRISHDYSNNGFGNDWSGAYNYLDKHLGLTRGFRDRVGKYRHGDRTAPVASYGDEDSILRELDALVDRVVELIVMREDRGVPLTPNPCDMHNLTDKPKRGERVRRTFGRPW